MATSPQIHATPPRPVIDIDAWTEEVEQTTIILSSTSLTPRRSLPRPSVSLNIPLNDGTSPQRASATPRNSHTVYGRTELIRRDSQKKRDALLKGKEGSRQRRRWENDRLLNNPHAAPPLPCDWEVRPSHPAQGKFPYYLAPLWEAEYKARCSEAPQKDEAGRVPSLLKDRLKKSRGAKGMLQDLENQIRDYIVDLDREPDSDDEIVFVGRDGSASPRCEALRRERLIHESLAEDHRAAFGRWLVHSIATYYGLDTWSITTGNPARREAYVAPKDKLPSPVDMPRPLWCMV